MTTEALAGYNDDDLLNALYETRELRGRIEQEIERRFTAGETTVIDTEHYTATQRTDTVKYVFSGTQLEQFSQILVNTKKYSEAVEIENNARQISRPFVSLSRKEPNEVAL